MIKKITHQIVLLFFIVLTQSNAIDLDEDVEKYLHINGFATVGASTIFESGQEFRAYTFQEDGVQKGEVNFANNTLLGLQAKLIITNNLSVTVQGILFNDHDNHFDADIDWAYLSYDTGYDLTFRAGQFRLPLFKSSELTSVGYTRTSVRPELAVYGVGGFTDYTGVDALYKTHAGTTDLSFQIGYGKSKESVTVPIGYREFKTNNAFIVKTTMEQEFGLLSMTYFRANSDFFNVNTDGLVLNDEETLVQMFSLETELHYEKFSFEAGVGKGWVDKIQPDEFLRYGTIYYQMGDWRPYITYSYKKFEEKPQHERRSETSLPPRPGFVPPPGPKSDRYEEIIGLGVRYDFSEKAALKVELDTVHGMETQAQLLISDNPNDRKATVLTISVDMVF